MTFTRERSTLPSAAQRPAFGKRNGADAVFFSALFLTAGVTLLTLTISPPAWWDECQIIDYGRTTFFHDDPTYGVSIASSGRVLQVFCYVGCLTQELAYRVAAGSMAGPRLSAMLGAMFAAVALRAWLKTAGASLWVATLLGCAFLWDPLIAQSYRGARVDCWCIGFMLMALACIRRSAVGPSSIAWLMAAAVLVALSALTWASAILLVPLLLQELAFCDDARAAEGRVNLSSFARTSSSVVKRILIMAPVALIATTVLLLPFYGRLYEMMSNLSDGVAGVVATQSSHPAGNFSKLLSQFLKSPVLAASAIGGAILVGPRTWLVPFGIAVCGATATGFLGNRVLYLVPYLAYGWAMTVSRAMTTSPMTGNVCRLVHPITALILLWGAGVTLAGRTSLALIESERRNPTLAEEFVDELVGERKGRVLLGSWSLYYPLRSRGWKYWGPYDLRDARTIEQKLDYDLVIHDESQGRHRLDGVLRDHGYSRSVHRLQKVGAPAGFLTRDTPGYGPYVVYTHPEWPAKNTGPEDAGD